MTAAMLTGLQFAPKLTSKKDMALETEYGRPEPLSNPPEGGTLDFGSAPHALE